MAFVAVLQSRDKIPFCVLFEVLSSGNSGIVDNLESARKHVDVAANLQVAQSHVIVRFHAT